MDSEWQEVTTRSYFKVLSPSEQDPYGTPAAGHVITFLVQQIHQPAKAHIYIDEEAIDTAEVTVHSVRTIGSFVHVSGVASIGGSGPVSCSVSYEPVRPASALRVVGSITTERKNGERKQEHLLYVILSRGETSPELFPQVGESVHLMVRRKYQRLASDPVSYGDNIEIACIVVESTERLGLFARVTGKVAIGPSALMPGIAIYEADVHRSLQTHIGELTITKISYR